jgi:ABC-type phosphate transport system auxiliary subunit
VDDDADCISCSDADEVLADARDPTEKRIAELEDKVDRLRLNSEAQAKLARKMSHKAADLGAEVERLRQRNRELEAEVANWQHIMRDDSAILEGA